METEEVPDPLEICKNPKVIKDAQEEIGKLDILVCGECHDVFHYIELFQEHHQEGKCSKTSAVRENYKQEPKAQVWAFMLWKNAQLKKTKDGETAPTSWMIYQRWCKLDTEEKDAWVAAGQAIQSFTKISTAKMQEIKVKPMTPVVRCKPCQCVLKNAAKNEDPLEEGELRLSQLTNAQRVAIKAQVASHKANTEVDPLADSEQSDMDAKGAEKTRKGNDTPKKTPFKPVQLNSDTTTAGKKPPELRKALRTSKIGNSEETLVERIVSRRFNHKKKCMEYFIKWESLNESDNTWEPKLHLEKCKTLVEEFDKVFNKPKTGPKLTKRVEESHSEHSESEEVAPGGRPQRTSKQKALNQVKVWCGDITEGEESSGKRKSFSDDDDSSDSFEKKIKLEEETDSSDDEKPSVTIRRVVKIPNSVNGVTKKPEAGFATSTPQRVVRVSQKQLPSLSSGVYIMSKTEGIIKLDSNTPPGGSPLLKVGPKIGQTHIKMVKKDAAGSSGNVSRTPMKTMPRLIKPHDSQTPLPKTLTKISTQNRKTPITAAAKPPVKVALPNAAEKVDLKKSKFEDDDSDGLEELEFPTDLPLPSPDSPPSGFTLCPLTGKILGENGEPVKQEEPLLENTSLDILVKQAVAELTDMDMDASTDNVKTENNDRNIEAELTASVISIGTEPLTSENVPMVVDSENAVVSTTSSSVSVSTAIISTPIGETAVPIETTSTIIVPSIAATSTIVVSIPSTTPVNTVPAIYVRSVPPIVSNSKIATTDDIEERLTPNTIDKSNPKDALTTITKPRPVGGATSLLNAALTNRAPQNPIRLGPPKKLLSTTPHTVRQKVTTVNRSSIHRSPLPSPSTTIIHKITPSKHRPVLPKNITHQEPMLKRTPNVTTYKPANVTRRIGNTTIYKSSKKPSIPFVKATPTPIAPVAQPALLPATPAVINMPLLTVDEEPSTSGKVETLNEIESLPTLPTDTGLADLSTFSLPDSETPLLITGEDGIIYQVAGQNEDGQTILISEGPDGQQQCVLVSSETTNEEVQSVIMDNSTTESGDLQQPLMVNTASEEVDAEATEGDGEESQVVAQIIKADPPSPGGTRKVVLMLPDGNLMMTDVTAEQYAALELDK